MGSTLDALHRLQGIELQLAAIRRTREAKARQAQVYKRKVDEIEQRLQENRSTWREHQLKLDTLSLDVAAREESVSKHRKALAKAKTNREYAAILTAMNSEKADNAKLENNILQLMETIQALEEEGTKVEAEKARLLERVAVGETALRTFDAESSEGRERLQADREACAETIPPAALAAFNRVAQHHGGEAMAAINKLSPKREEYGCSGCNMQVALEVVNALQTRDEIQTCSVCGRLLYLESQPAKK